MNVGLFKKLRKRLTYLSDSQVALIYKAYLVSYQAHQGQKRSSGDPYISHPVAVAENLADLKMDQNTLMAALLHDVIEDTTLTKHYLFKQFGQQVADLVDGVSKLTQIEFKSQAEARAENFRKMVLAMTQDIRVILVKLADRLHNMRTLDSLPKHKQRRIARETLDIFAPIAQRLGMHDMAVELEDLCFEALHPTRYRVLSEAMRKARGHRKNVLQQVNQSIREGLQGSGVTFYEVTTREKHLYSIYRKMRNKKKSFSDIMDVYAFRIIVDSKQSCYQALGVVHSLYKPLPERFKDYIAIPKANGYQSLHSTLFGPHGVPVEVQIRTKEMDQFATKGIAAHWMYRQGEGSLDERQLRNQQWLNNLLELQKTTGNPLEFIENAKIDLFPDEVYVFSPKGEIFELPRGSTAVDFAYAVHTDVGNSCSAAKIDHKLAPLSTILKNGQTIEVLASKSARPNPAWLNFVVTGKAKSCIRSFLKKQQREHSVALGEQLLSKSFQSYQLGKKELSDEIKNTIVQETGLSKWEDVLEEIGLGNRMAALVAQRVHDLLQQVENSSEELEPSTKPVEIKGTEGVVVNYAACCLPIPGDPIISVIRQGSGLIVHHQQCQRMANAVKDPEKYMAVNWADNVAGEFCARLQVDVLNEVGVLASVTSVIAEAGSGIRDLVIRDHDERYYILVIKILVQNRQHLDKIIRRLQRYSYVLKVQRLIN